jgi:nucleoid-associated protein YgaU
MAFSRYARDYPSYDGKGYAASRSIATLRANISAGYVPIQKVIISTEGDRLDTIAGAVYGDGRYWWVLAAASNIGWGMQVPPGTIINVPDIKVVENMLG